MKLDDTLLPILYMLAAMGFILAIKWMNSPATARRGVIVGEIGMLLAVVGTLLRFEVVNYQWILIAFFLGSAVGIPIAYIMPMTAVPQRTAFSHACGALASALIGTAEYTPYLRAIGWLGEKDPFRSDGFVIALAAIMGAAIVNLALIVRQAIQRFREKSAAAWTNRPTGSAPTCGGSSRGSCAGASRWLSPPPGSWGYR